MTIQDDNFAISNQLSHKKMAAQIVSPPYQQQQESFQVIWRRLCFESHQNKWDRHIGSCHWLKNLKQFFSSASTVSYDLNAAKNMHNQQHSDYMYDGSTIELGAQSPPISSSSIYANKLGQKDSHGRSIFKNLNGSIKSDQLTAILGPSGSGKTSLLNAICGRVENYTGIIELRHEDNLGLDHQNNQNNQNHLRYQNHLLNSNHNMVKSAANISYNNHHNKRKTLRLSIIPQKDYLIENLTVYENLMFASKILNCNKSNFDHEANIERVVKMLNLRNCIDSRVSNISGGEYKRVSIGQEFLSQPDILILDEPTSGLDSVNCKNLIKSLNQLIAASREGSIQPIAIVMTIHQPDIDIFNRFDHVYCLAKGGRVIFDGKPGDVLGLLRNQVGDMLMQQQRHSLNHHHDQQTNQSISSSAGIDTGSELDIFDANVNPANLLIEIASEDIYGDEPIDRLSKYQLEQFEFELPEISSNQLTRCQSNEQLNLNLLLQTNDQHNLVGNNKKQKSNVTKNPIENVVIKSSKSLSSFHTMEDNQLMMNTPPTSLSPAANDEDNQVKPEHQLQQQQLNIIASNGGAGLDGIRKQFDNKTSKILYATTNSGSSSNNQQTSSASAVLIGKSNHQLIRDKRLSTTKNNGNNHRFFYQTYLLTKRSFKSALRDPLMTMTSMIFHLIIPFVMWLVYSRNIGTVKACPIVEREIDLLALGKNETIAMVGELQDELTTALECSTMFFLATYSFSMCSLSIAALAFPLNMHVLLKETRNGWYNLSSFVVAKTLSSFPFEVLFPVVSISMIYLLLDMPSSEWHWRLIALMLVMALISMISHTQGLIFGALCMDSVQTAIFLASATTLPQALLSGFTARIKHMPIGLQYISWASLYRYSSDCINIIRFGYGTCPCSNKTDSYLRDNQASLINTRDLPPNAQTMAINYLVEQAKKQSNETRPQIPGIGYRLLLNETEQKDLVDRLMEDEVDLFSGIADLIARSFSYGEQVDSCKNLRSQLLQTTSAPDDSYLPYLLGGMVVLLLLYRIGLFIVVKCKLTSRI